MAVDVVARLRLRAENCSREVRKAFEPVPEEAERAGREAGQRMGSGLGAGLKSTIAAVSFGAIVREIAQVTSRAIDFGVELGNNARALNTNVEELQAYRTAASQVNIEHQRLDSGLNNLLKTMVKAEGGNKDATAAFKGLGIELRETDGAAKTTTAVMGEAIDQIRRIPDPLRQAQYGTMLFGDEWRNISPLLEAGAEGLRTLAGEIQGTGEALSSKEIQELERINSEFERMKNALEVDISRAVAANADAIISLGRSFNYMAGEAVRALAAVVNLYRGLNANGTYAGSGAASEENARIIAENRGDEPYDPDALINIRRTGNRGTMRLRDPSRPHMGYVRIRLPKGGRGGGGGVGNWRDDPVVAATVPPPVADPLGGARAGGSAGKPKARAGGGVDKEERDRLREAERLAREYDRISSSLAGQVTRQQEIAEIEALRALMGDREAEKLERVLEINRQNEKLVGKTAKQLAEEFPIPIAQAEADLRALEQLRLRAVRDVDVKFDQREAEAAAKEGAKIMQLNLKAQADIRKADEDRRVMEARQQFDELSSFYFDLFDGNTRSIWNNFKRAGLGALAELAAHQTLQLLGGKKGIPVDALKELFGGVSRGMAASSIAGTLGIKQSNTGAAVGSIAGSLIPGLGPLGGAIGGLLGGTIGGLFKKAPKGHSVITGADDGGYSVSGNKARVRDNLSGASNSVQDGLRRIADALDADLGGFRVSIGEYKGQYRVSGSGSSAVGSKKFAKKAGSDLLYQGGDASEATRVAILNAIQDGAIKGISEAAQRILRSGKDIESAVEKALMIEELPKLLKARLDPLGAAIDEVDAKFQRLADVLKEGGASAEQVAQARQLWELERADAVREIGAASAVLADYLKSLRVGPDSPLSLRSQATEAEAAMAPYLAQIRAADDAKARYDALVASGASDTDLKLAKDAAAAAAAAIDQAGFRDSAALFLDVTRQLGGSTKGFFDQFDRIQGLTNSAIALVENAVPLRGESKDPFAELTATATRDTANILDMQSGQLAALVDQNAQLLELMGAMGSFIGESRNFMNMR